MHVYVAIFTDYKMLPTLEDIKLLSKQVPSKRFNKLNNGKRRCDMPQETLLVDQHPDEPNFHSYLVSKNRLIPWIRALIEHYGKQPDKELLFTCYDEAGREVSVGVPCIPKVVLQVSPIQGSTNVMHTFSLYLKIGMITIKEARNQQFNREEFTEIKMLVDKHTNGKVQTYADALQLNSTTIDQSSTDKPRTGPDISPIKSPDGTEGGATADRENEDDESGQEDDEPGQEITALNKTLSNACSNIDSAMLSLKEAVEQSTKDNINATNNIGSKVETLIVDSTQMKNDIATVKNDISKIMLLVTELNNQKKCKCSKTDAARSDSGLQMTDPPPHAKTVPNGQPIPKSYAAITQNTGASPETPQNKVKNDAAVNQNKVKNDTATSQNNVKTTETPEGAQSQVKINPSLQNPVNTQKSPKPTPTPHVRDSTPKLSQETLRLVLSDSLTRDINALELDPSGLTQIKCFGGFTANALNNKLSQFPKSNKMSHVLTHIGINDVSSPTVPMVKTTTSRLITTVKLKFPNAKLTFSGILPTKHGYTSEIQRYNEAVSEVCKSKDVEFIEYGAAFDGVKQAYSSTESDHIHLGPKGSSMLMAKFQECFGLEAKQTEEQASTTNSGHPIPTRVSGRDESQTTQSSFTPEKLVSIEPQTVRGKDVFQAFGAPCQSLAESRCITEEIFKKFPDTLNATCVIRATCVEVNGVLKYKLDNDGEKGACERIQPLMEKIGMKNCTIVITRHFGQHISTLRWTVIQSQLTQIAEKLGYTVPSLNIHNYVPRQTWSRGPRVQRYEQRSDYTSHKQNGSNPYIKPLIDFNHTWPNKGYSIPQASQSSYPYFPQYGPSPSHYPSGRGSTAGYSFPASQGFSNNSWGSYNNPIYSY